MESAVLDTLYAKMGEYTKMEEEIGFDEFSSFYQELLGLLQASYQDMDEDALVKAKGMCMIVAANAQMRSARKDANRKKFAKMSEKAKFWEDAIVLRLGKEGLDKDSLDEKVGALWA